MANASDPASQNGGSNENESRKTESFDPCQRLLSRIQRSPPSPDAPGEEKLIITQVNLKQSNKRLRHLEIAIMSEPQLWGIVAIQDVPPRTPWLTSGVRQSHHVWYQAERPLVEDDHPMHMKDKSSNVKMAKSVCFLVPRTIPTTKWRVKAPDWDGDMLATLHLETLSGEIQIHNVYRNTNSPFHPLDVERLVRECSGPHSVLLGDFNLHHKLWAGRDTVPCKDSATLARTVETGNLHLCTTPGAITFTRSSDPEGPQRSTLDLTFIGSFLLDRLRGWSVVDVSGFDSDHRVVRTTLACPPIFQVSIHRRWQETPLEDYRSAVEAGLKALPRPDLETIEGIDAGLWDVFEAIHTAIEEHVPKDDGVEPQNDGDDPQDDGDDPQDDGDDPQDHEDEPVNPQRHPAGAKQKTYKQAVTSDTTGDAGNTQKWAKRTRRRARPALRPFTPDFHFKSRIAKTSCQKADMYMEAVYGEEKTSRERSVHPELPPDIDCSLPPGDELDRMVPGDDKQLGEVLGAIKRLPDRKATGVDDISNEALKMAGEIITPYLEDIFAACLVKTHFPKFLKLSRTILFPKPGKADHIATSYRPIALLTSIGKLLERVILQRIRLAFDALPKSDALPRCQFGGLSGRSTTSALHRLLNFVHIGFAKGFKSTILGLDITGAFPHVDRNRLLTMLADKGVPGYIIRIIWSWMCDRQTVLEIPGEQEQLFFENGGLPQGSCLSPFLFLVFASPLFDVDPFLTRHKFIIFAFVDDTYITAQSPSFDTNCKILALVHDKLYKWAEDNAVTFDPGKYGLLHFLGPRDGVQMIKSRPDIEDLPPDEILFKNPFLTILGVRVDNRLSWQPHLDLMIEKVSKTLRVLKQMSGSNWGPGLEQMRMLYTSQVEPILTYASPVWFITGLKPRKPGCLTQKRIKLLDRLQNECLHEISGAMDKTCAHVIRKELCIPKLSVSLAMKTLAYFAKRIFHSPTYLDLELERNVCLSGARGKSFDDHPLQQVQRLAKEVIKYAKARLEYYHGEEAMLEKWNNPRAREAAIDNIARQAVHEQCAEDWEEYRQGWGKRHSVSRPLALAESWGYESPFYYDGLPRKESTMLLHCRTGNIGLAANLYRRGLHPTETCPFCGNGRHTVEHLFIYCTGKDCYGRSMSKRRATLYKNAEGLTDLHRIFAEHPDEAAKFAIRTFAIPQFTRKNWKFRQGNKKRRHPDAAADVDAAQPAANRKRRKILDLRLRNVKPPAILFPVAAAAAAQRRPRGSSQRRPRGGSQRRPRGG